jgi:tetratricopeptide (TPR) repeat protein
MTDATAARTALEEQRDFLLRSLEDLEREHEVGDIDEHDYAALKDDYTSRAAAVLRAIAAEPRPPRRPGRRSLARRALPLLGVLAFAGLAGLLVAQMSGRRDEGQFSSGDVRQSVTEKLNEAGQRFSDGDADGAIALYDEVLEDQPTNAEALTYKGWALYTLVGDEEAALTALLDAATAHKDYPDVHAFLAVLFFRSGLVEQADRELERLDALDPPPDIRQLTETLRADIDAALASTTTTAAASP